MAAAKIQSQRKNDADMTAAAAAADEDVSDIFRTPAVGPFAGDCKRPWRR